MWLTVVYLTHFQSYALLTVSLTFLGVFLYVYDAFESPRVRLAAQLKPILLFLGSMLPAYVILLSYYLVKREGGGFHRSFEGLMKYFLSIGSIVSFRDTHILIGNLLLAVLAIAFLLTVIDRVRKIYALRAASKPGNGGAGGIVAIVDRTDAFLVIALMLTFLYSNPRGVCALGVCGSAIGYISTFYLHCFRSLVSTFIDSLTTLLVVS